MIIFAMPDLPSIFVYIIISSNYDAPVAPHYNTIIKKTGQIYIYGCIFDIAVNGEAGGVTVGLLVLW
jgi:hypothetical protein